MRTLRISMAQINPIVGDLRGNRDKIVNYIKRARKLGADLVAFTELAVTGQSDMPSMRGAHDSGEVAFKTNRAGDYLLPVNVVMPGDWEVRLTFSRNGIVIFRGRILFDV